MSSAIGIAQRVGSAHGLL